MHPLTVQTATSPASETLSTNRVNQSQFPFVQHPPIYSRLSMRYVHGTGLLRELSETKVWPST